MAENENWLSGGWSVESNPQLLNYKMGKWRPILQTTLKQEKKIGNEETRKDARLQGR